MENIQKYPIFSAPVKDFGSSFESTAAGAVPFHAPVSELRVEKMSDQAAMTDERTMRTKDTSMSPVTRPPNHITSPYAYSLRQWQGTMKP